MKNPALALLPLILFSCTGKPKNSANNGIPKSFQQITYLLDTIADKYVINELKNISDVSLNEEGEIKSAVQTSFSFKNQEGSKEESIKFYSPILCWSFSGDSIPILLKYYKQALTDTLLKDGEYTFQYDKNSRLISFSQAYQSDRPVVIIDFLYDLHGQWTQITKHFREERSDHITYEITKREIQYNDKPVKSINPTYLTVNGENIFKKKKRSIVDYYVLLQKAAIFIPDNKRGMFDVPNGFFEYEDEGTGAGVWTGQLDLFRTKDGKDILAISGFYNEPIAYPNTSGTQPNFYLFEPNAFTEISNIFPEVNIQMFFDSDYTGSVEGISTYFTLPRKGLSIQYNVNNLGNFCKLLDSKNDNYNRYKEICDRYSNIKRTSIDIAFDPVSGTFKIKN
jgi:hypothetical protein